MLCKNALKRYSSDQSITHSGGFSLSSFLSFVQKIQRKFVSHFGANEPVKKNELLISVAH